MVLRFLLIAAGIGLSVLLARFLWSSRIISDRPPPPPPDPTINEPLLKQRRQALADLEDLRVPLQQQLKFVFQQWGAPADVVEDATPPMPEVITTTSRCKKQIRELWDLAYSRDRKTITTERWKEIEDMIEQLTEAAQTGQWHFGTVKEGR